ncbi:MAG: hypothetical protein NTX50_26370 [Candidatus Sumerlaeota bacterium]|nr:hypothetical protein [Candidatus Sumerlaeota bacterium]
MTWGLLIAGFSFSHGRFQFTACILGFFFLGPITAIWLQIRLAPAIFSLADRVRREELAVTGLSPDAYLTPLLKPRILRLTAPIWSVFPMLIIVWLENFRIWCADSDSAILYVTSNLAALFLGLSNLVLSLGGIFLLMARLCRSRSRTAGFKALIPFAAAIVSIMGPLIIFVPFAVFTLYNSRNSNNINGALIANTVFAFLLMISSFPVAWALRAVGDTQ